MENRKLVIEHQKPTIKQLKDQKEAFYFAHCKGKLISSKQKNDYSSGWIIFINIYATGFVGFYFFRTSKKQWQINQLRRHLKDIQLQKYENIEVISSIHQDQQKLIIKYKVNNALHLKFNNATIVKEWKAVIYQHRADLEKARNYKYPQKEVERKELRNQNQGLFSTRESQSNSYKKKEEKGQLKQQKLKQQSRQQQLELEYRHKVQKLSQQLSQQRLVSSQLESKCNLMEVKANRIQKDSQEQIMRLKQKLNFLQNKLSQLTINKQMLTLDLQKMSQIKQQCLQLRTQNYKKQTEIKQLNKKTQLHNEQIKYIITFSLFHGEILDQSLFHHKQFLKQQIQNFENRSILVSMLIYKFDGKNKVNFHHYIDGKSNIVLLALTSNGNYLAAFSQSAITKEDDANDGGLIISLSNKKTFRCRSGNKSVSYDQYYICFGNSEIRIQSQQNQIFSNFGMSNGYYANNGMKVDILLGENNREVDLDHYQIYQISFD